MNTLFPVVILAGGLATRLYPLTQSIPKSLIEINGEPFIAHQLRLLKQNNIQQIFLCIGFLGEQIREWVGNGEKFGLHITYIEEKENLLGTAGAIKNALAYLTDYFFVLYGDSYLPCNYEAIQQKFIQDQKLALMTIFKNEGEWDTSNIVYQDKKMIAYDKKNRTSDMQYIDYGLSIFSKSIFSHLSDGIACDLSEVFQQLLKQNQLTTYEITERFYEIGSLTGIKDLTHYFNTSHH